MPSFVLSLALLLLVLLTLLAVSNRELIALMFLGFSTAALPLSIWIVGAIALGFLLGIWILLLFRFGTVGLGSGSPVPGRRRANYGPEDFAVVDERFAEGGDRYEEGRYGEHRYDDVYSQEQYGGASAQGSYQRYATDRDYQAEGQSNAYGSDGYGSDGYGSDGYEADRYGRAEGDYGAGQQAAAYGERAEQQNHPQDRFSADSGYESGRGGAEVTQPSGQTDLGTESGKTTLQQPTVTADPTIPADWDDQYREDWTQEELLAEPVLRNEGAAPKLKRWLSQPGEGRPKLNLGGFGLGVAAGSDTDGRSAGKSADVERSPAAQGEVSDWQGSDSGGRYDGSDYDPSQGRGDVYDADYRVVRPPEAEPEPRPAANEPKPRQNAAADSTGQEAKGNRSKSEWDIESDLDW